MLIANVTAVIPRSEDNMASLKMTAPSLQQTLLLVFLHK